MTCISSIFSAQKLIQHRQNSLLCSLLSIPRTVKPNDSVLCSAYSHRCIIRHLDTLYLVLQLVLWKEILAMSREETLVISVGLNDGGTWAKVEAPEHICPVTQTELLSCQTEQTSNYIFAVSSLHQSRLNQVEFESKWRQPRISAYELM